MRIRRSLRTGAVVLVLVLSGCSWSDSDGSSPADQTAEPSSTPTEFEQSFAGAVSGEAAAVTVSTDRTGLDFTEDDIGVSFEATDLTDPRLDPAQSNLD